MNERIRELAEQADQYARSDNSAMLFENFQKRYAEKFAELLIKECVNVMEITDITDFRGVELALKIKKHFGVE